MTRLKSVTVNADHTVASVGAGASWLDVYLYLDPLGLSVAGGRNGAVGAGGLTLGGGISYFAPLVGFTCDTVVNFQVCLKLSLIPSVFNLHFRLSLRPESSPTPTRPRGLISSGL